MSLFKKLFGKSDNKESISTNNISASPEISTNSPELFKEELYDSLKRYYSSPALNIELNLKDEKGNIYKEHEAFDFTFTEWKKIRSVWDRRAILFQHWDESEFNKLEKWQIIERFVKDRYAPKAVAFQKNNITQEDFQDIRLIVALSKLHRALDAIPNALHYAKGAFKLRPDLDIVKVEYANTLHLSDSNEDQELSHKLISEVIEAKNEKGQSLLDYFIFSNGYLDSSIFAINFLKAGDADEASWEKLAAEYYWCPIFRFEHSVFLSRQGESLKALAKLNSLADEFPWYKAGVLANIEAINQMRTQSNNPALMSEEMNRMIQYKSKWE